MYDLYDQYELAHGAGWESCNSQHDLAHSSLVGDVPLTTAGEDLDRLQIIYRSSSSIPVRGAHN